MLVSRVAAILLAISALAVHGPATAACSLGRVARLSVTMEGLRASVPVTVNGQPTRLWLDSGAFWSFMSKARATELGLKTRELPEGFYMTGIGGSTTGRLATIKSFGIAGVTLDNVAFIVGGSDAGNGLIGLNLLAAYDTDYDLANGAVDLMKATDCADTNLAHWAGDKAVSAIDLLPGNEYHDNHIYTVGQINGKTVRIMFDTGSPSSFALRWSVEKIGIKLSAPGVIRSDDTSGIGGESRASWIVKLDSFAIGGEEIRHTAIHVVDEDRAGMDADVVLGADFFLAHHIFVVRSQHRIYLTYNGGPVFSLTTDREAGKAVTRTENTGGTDKIATPVDATGFARRGAARSARGDTAGAVADLSEAIRLDPKSADHFHARAQVYSASGDVAKALQDMDAAIALTPENPQFLVARGLLRIKQHDAAGARADAAAAEKLVPAGSLDNTDLIDLFELIHQPERNIALLDPMIALHKDDHTLGQLLNARCWARGLANVDLDKAMGDCNAAIHRDGAQPAILDSRALIRVRQKNYAAAIADYDTVLKVAPDQSGSLYMRGWAKRASGRTAEGAADMAAAKKLKPDIAEKFEPYGFKE
jgi:predicted aspartyl protease/tetratricopeptide (TPR) repeat protein